VGEDGKIVYKVVINDDGVENEAEAAVQLKIAEKGASAY
jgi:hypothetical protein